MISSAFSEVRRVSNASTRTLGLMSRRRSSADWSLDTPTRDVPCRIWRCRFVWSTTSKSTMPIVPTPAAALYLAAAGVGTIGIDVEVNDADRSHASGGEVERGRRAEAARAHEQHPGALQLPLPRDADIGEDEVTRVAQDLLVRQLGQLLLHGRASGDARDDRHGVTRRDRRLMLPQLPDVPVVHVYVDETAQSSVACKEVPPQGGVFGGQLLQQFAHARGLQLDRVPPTREGAERRGDPDRDCHATVRSSMIRGAASNDARSSDRIHAFRSPALRPATAAITYTSRGHALSRSYCEGMGGWSGCE